MLKALKSAILFVTTAVFGNEYNTSAELCVGGHNNQISCHKTYIEDDLPIANDMEFPEKSIFFVETSCNGGLDSRQTCSVESAARTHPLWQVNVLFAGPVHAKCHQNRTLPIFKRYSNVKFFRIHTQELAKGTPLEKFLDLNPLKYSKWPVSHASDILRYLILYVWSGIYLDLDMIVLKPFDGLARNWAAKEKVEDHKAGMATGAISFSGDYLGREVAAAALVEMKSDFRGWKWNHNGPGVMHRVLRRLCSTDDPEIMSARKCQGFEVYDAHLFYPVRYNDARTLFEEGQLDLESAYTCHVWTTSGSYFMGLHQNSPYAKLAASHCPSVFSRYGPLFGTVDLLM